MTICSLIILVYLSIGSIVSITIDKLNNSLGVKVDNRLKDFIYNSIFWLPKSINMFLK